MWGRFYAIFGKGEGLGLDNMEPLCSVDNGSRMLSPALLGEWRELVNTFRPPSSSVCCREKLSCDRRRTPNHSRAQSS
eukprot:365617-Chlamydomonas_euryale.AAC.4